MEKEQKSRNQVKNQRERLWKIDPRCFWCMRVTVLPHAPSPPKGGWAANIATIDHLYDRKHELRHSPQKHNQEMRRVLACYACNMKRGGIRIRSSYLK